MLGPCVAKEVCLPCSLDQLDGSARRNILGLAFLHAIFADQLCGKALLSHL